MASALHNAVLSSLLTNFFKVKISTSGHDSYEAWREGDHDDLVLAALLALWGCVLGDLLDLR